jgi:hypothetical protein
MRDFLWFPMQNEQARTIPPRAGLLGNQLRRQIEMEVGSSHPRERNGAGRGLTIHSWR